MNIEQAYSILKARRETNGSHIEAMYQILGKRYAKSNARKYNGILERFIDLIRASKADGDDYEGTVLSLESKTNEQIKTMLWELAKLEGTNAVELLELHGYDPSQFELSKHIMKAWKVYSKKDGVNNLMSSAITVKPLQNKLSSQDFINIFNDLQTPKLQQYNYEPSNQMLEVNMADVHLGKFSWADETKVDYDLKIAEQCYKQVLKRLFDRLEAGYIKPERIILPIGQDFYHYDNEQSTTKRGTAQDTDTRFQKMYRKGVELLVWTIETLRQYAPVECYFVEGNHDYKMSYFAYETLRAWYRNEDSVIFNNDLYPRKYIQYGKCGLCLTHGSEESKKELEGIFAKEAPKIWGNTVFREIHATHLHSRSMYEINGMLVRRLSAITASDKWHVDKGYTKAIRQAQFFVWDKNQGLTDIINSVVLNDEITNIL